MTYPEFFDILMHCEDWQYPTETNRGKCKDLDNFNGYCRITTCPKYKKHIGVIQ